jgi:hypothetical protein
LERPHTASLDRRLAPRVAQTVAEAEPRPFRPSPAAIIVALLIALGVGLPSFDLVPWSSAERPTLLPATDDASPSGDGDATLEIGWPAVENAVVYDVVLWRGRRRMLDLWPRTNSIDVREAVAKSGKQLPPGTYQWFVFAGFGPRDDLRFGKTVANGSFTIE